MKQSRFVLAVAAILLVGIAAPVAVALSPAMAVLNSITAVSCATTPTKIALPVTGEPARSICVQNISAVDVYVGGNSVTTANGFLLPSASSTAPVTFCADVQTMWCTVAAATSPLRVVAGTGYSGR